jgi:hypothetical protein
MFVNIFGNLARFRSVIWRSYGRWFGKKLLIEREKLGIILTTFEILLIFQRFVVSLPH